MVTVHYSSFSQKHMAYVTQTLPAVLRLALDPSLESATAIQTWMLRNRITRANFERDQVGTLRQLHEAVRAEKYVRETLPQDNVQPIAATLRYGGDCEDWAIVLFAALTRLGIEAFVETSGDFEDSFKHVYVIAIYAGTPFILDPKGDQNGAEFDQHSEAYPVRHAFKADRMGKMIEVLRG